MSENNRLSYSAISTYSTCGKKYELRYLRGLRSKVFSAALAYGSAVDVALNKLLLTKDLDESIKEFDKTWNFQFINKKYTAIPRNVDLAYAEADFDFDLLKEEDLDLLTTEALGLVGPGTSSLDLFRLIKSEKEEKGWLNLSNDKREYFNYMNWLCMKNKGHIMLESYEKKILPQIKEVLAVQKEQYLKNENNDVIVQYLDVIVKWKDDRILLADNKTAAKRYDKNQAARSQQLISYFNGAKDEYKLDAVAFFVLDKHIFKNKIKVCSFCGYDGSGGSHKTCPSDNPETGKRCNGTWNVKIDPECFIDVIINEVTPTAEDLVMSSFDEANEGIRKKVFHKNLGACHTGFSCEFSKLCWAGDNSELVDLSEKKE